MQSNGIRIPGLPEGVLAIGVRAILKNECYWADGIIRQKKDDFDEYGLVLAVEPNHKWIYDLQSSSWRAVRNFDKRLFSVVFSAENDAEMETIEYLRKCPQFVSVEEKCQNPPTSGS